MAHLLDAGSVAYKGHIARGSEGVGVVSDVEPGPRGMRGLNGLDWTD